MAQNLLKSQWHIQVYYILYCTALSIECMPTCHRIVYEVKNIFLLPTYARMIRRNITKLFNEKIIRKTNSDDKKIKLTLK